MTPIPRPKNKAVVNQDRLRARLTGILHSFRTRFSHSAIRDDLDRMLAPLVFRHELTGEKLSDMLVSYPRHLPDDFFTCLIVLAQDAVRDFADYPVLPNPQSYRRLLAKIVLLERIYVVGQEWCEIVPDVDRGFRVQLKKNAPRPGETR